MIILFSFALPCGALEQHKFFNNDNSQSFYAELTGYDAAKQVVTVKLENGKKSKFKLSLLSEGDQKYVIHNQVTLVAVKRLEVSFKEVKGKKTRTKEGLIRTSVTPISYNVTVYNRSKTPIKDVKLNYHYYYCVGTLTPGGPKHTPKVTTGGLVFNELAGQDTAVLTTSAIDIIRASKKGVPPPNRGGGGWGSINDGDIDPNFFDGRRKESMLCGGGGSPGARRIDHVIGLVVEILLEGEVVKTVSDYPKLLQQHREKKVLKPNVSVNQF